MLAQSRSYLNFGSSEELVGRFRLGQLAKCVIKRKFKAAEGAEAGGGESSP
jgi:hypothetical protein